MTECSGKVLDQDGQVADLRHRSLMCRPLLRREVRITPRSAASGHNSRPKGMMARSAFMPSTATYLTAIGWCRAAAPPVHSRSRSSAASRRWAALVLAPMLAPPPCEGLAPGDRTRRHSPRPPPSIRLCTLPPDRPGARRQIPARGRASPKSRGGRHHQASPVDPAGGEAHARSSRPRRA